jgi:hypothetical protein
MAASGWPVEFAVVESDATARLEALLATMDDEQYDNLKFRFNERVAIVELDGGLPEDRAEQVALEEIRRAVEGT